jgi:uncharacterized protein
MNLWLIFLTGLTTGGLSCLAVQGGFLASIIANYNSAPSAHAKYFWLPVSMFLIAKLISHTVLGFFLGLLGSTLTLSLQMQLFFQAFTALFMFATAMNLLNAHPIFRYVAFQPPKFITKHIRSLSKDDSVFAPFVLGLFTVFIPCGVTQAMEVNAIAVGNPIQSALLMFAFVLGTAPLFSIIGVAMAKLSEGLTQKFLTFSALALIGMALFSFNGVLEVVSFPLSGSRIREGWISFWTPDPIKARRANQIQIVNGSQQVTIDIKSNGYSPNYIRVKKGVPVQMTLRSNNVYSCALSFTMKSFGIKEFLNATDQKTIAFTPEETGKYPFSCSMGMYTGTMEVI